MEVKYLAHAKQMQALELIPEIAGEFKRAFGRDSGGLIRTLPQRGRGDDRRGARLGARHDQGHDRRAARAGREDRRGRDLLVPARSRSRRCERRSVMPSVWSCWRRRSRSASAGSSRRTCAWRSPASSLHGYTVIAGLGGRPITKASLHSLFTDAAADRLEALTFLDMDWDVVEPRARADGRLARLGSARREHPARPRHGRGGAGVRSGRA